MATIVWFGLGRMGRPMATRLIAAGHRVLGVEVDAHAREAAAADGIEIIPGGSSKLSDADVVFSMLPAGRHVASVLAGPDGVFNRIGSHTVVVDSSTIDIATVRDLHRRASECGVRFLDAPVSGGVEGATTGTLTFMVGGDAATLEMVNPVLAAMAGTVLATGGPGTGQAAKIVNNMIFGVCLAATCEGVVLADRLGLDQATFYKIATSSSGDNFPLRRWYPAAGVLADAPSSHDFAPGFTTSLLVKDLSLAVEAARETATPLAVARVAHELFRDSAITAGDLDCTALVLSLAKATAT